MTGPWPGRYYSGLVTTPHDVEASLDAGRLVIRGPTLSEETGWPTDEVRLVDGPDRDGRLRFARMGTAERLTLTSSAGLTDFEGNCPHLRAGPGDGPGWRTVLLASLGAVAATAFLYVLVLPFAAHQAVRWVSPALEAKIGERTADLLIRMLATTPGRRRSGDPPECNGANGLMALNRLTGPLIAQGSWTNPPRVQVVNTPDVNALALPGGRILLFRGIIDFAAGPNELAGVIAHELGHIALGHPIELAVERGGRSFLVGLLLGDVLGGSMIAGIGHLMLEAKYGRDAERAADARGLAFLAGAGLDARPFGELFLRLSARPGPAAAFLDDHPPGEDRMKTFAASPADGGKALSDEEWTALKTVCDR